jgi:hypothetical protein
MEKINRPKTLEERKLGYNKMLQADTAKVKMYQEELQKLYANINIVQGSIMLIDELLAEQKLEKRKLVIDKEEEEDFSL